MSKNNPFIITKAELFDNQLLFSYQKQWFQEDIETLSTDVFSKLAEFTIIEKIQGADRENIRFSWEKRHFILNFDCYSQSCWIEGGDQQSTELIPDLVKSFELVD
ncbi:DUF3630 family protein [Colwellia sp. D2M02]|uniref:DUF3630 family protein n=1 Tax=Colwellia sp. D2M02 TaxID=2841562 RepID=UPI001C091957|nr:DUF3630 family protein [Colwellia sp. D2M02]MBU2895009.1 DUF3630 family protein [Colwellia sp. D2M02]